MKRNAKGITLLALVITIIVLLILASVGLRLALGDGGILDEARGAVNEWDRATEGEQSDLSKLAGEMRNARNGVYNGTTSGGNSSGDGTGGDQTGGGNTPGGGDIDVSGSISSITGTETENTETTDKLGNKIVVPAGFKVINPEDDVTKGIIIEDVGANDATSRRKSICMDTNFAL